LVNPGQSDSRDRIIRAAVDVFAEAGYRGATTRRIAQQAGVNEVTLFRHFGSKEELIEEALTRVGEWDEVAEKHLAVEPGDCFVELTEFARAQLTHLFRIRSLIRTCMGEGEERPAITTHATERPRQVHDELLAYLRRLRDNGVVDADADVEVAATVLMGSLFSDAMGRDYMPGAYTYSIEEAPARYVALILRSLGVRASAQRRRGKAEER
jgi:AcrR family transcriptional regulator